MTTQTLKKKRNNKSLFKRISAWLHLWLGLASGIIVVIVSLTGCMYVFEHEIKDMIEDWRFVKPQAKAFLTPSQLVEIADKHMKGKHASSVTISGKEDAAIVGYFSPSKDRGEGSEERGRKRGKKDRPTSSDSLSRGDSGRGGRKGKKDRSAEFASNDTAGKRMRADLSNGKKGGKDSTKLAAAAKEKPSKGGRGRRGGVFTSVYMNPYTGAVLNVKSVTRGESPDFFRFMLNGHRALWLPYEIGRPIVGVGVLTFVVLLITGMVLWWPVKWIKSIRDKSFKIKFSGTFKRVNYDTHNVLGFYSMIFLLLISMTGLVWSFEWFSKSLYWVTSGGKPLVESREEAKSDTTLTGEFAITSVDKIFFKLKTENPQAASILVSIPKRPADAIGGFVYKQMNTFYNMDRYSFDQHTLKAVTTKTPSPFAGKYVEANVPDKIRRMNY
ncbi:MAG: PepSY domain-containing protein, partial [Sphingobacteriales bacterium]